MSLPIVKVRETKRYKALGSRQWHPTLHGALLRHAYDLIKAKCPRTASGKFCNTDEHDCKWHNFEGWHSKRVANRIVRMWMRAMSAREDYGCTVPERIRP